MPSPKVPMAASGPCRTQVFSGAAEISCTSCAATSEPGPSFFHAMVTAMFEQVCSMDPELPAEVIDAVFKELLVHEGLTFAQCEHVMDKLMQRGEQMEYLFHEWSGVFPTLPAHARQALAKGLLPLVGRCPHAALDFVLKELDAIPLVEGRTKGSGFARGCLCARRHRSGTPASQRIRVSPMNSLHALFCYFD
mmetsp:Transcript_64532/g.105990  ORF Transcript_64532/g.105990 Transcript_64532/m.105990 type:complete len:193 (+) Transcript_64532:788-1366(+)